MRFVATARGRWFLLAGLWLLLLLLGIGGFLQQSRDTGGDRSVLDTLYLTLQLATLEYGGGDDAVNWRLQIARFIAPVMAAGTILQTASVVFAEQFRRWRIRFSRGHTVVAGLGETGTRLAQAFAGRGERVVAVESDPACPGIATVRDHGVAVLVGDAHDERTLRAARVDRADRLIAVCGDDAANVQTALGAAALLDTTTRRRPKALRCAVHLDDSELAALLRSTDLDARDSLRWSFFNLHERAARALLAEHPPFGAPGDSPHVMVLGLGQLGRSLVVAIAQAWAARSDRPLPLTLVDRSASGRWEAMRLQHPALGEVCAPRFVDTDLDQPSAVAVESLIAIVRDEPPTWTAVVFEDESLALSSALFLQQHATRGVTTTVVRTRTEAGLGALLASGAGRVSGALGSIRLFPFLDRACTVDTVDGGVREQLARALHEEYLADHAGAPGPLTRPWDELDDDQRDLSRRRVDGIIADLDAVGCDLVPLRRWGAAPSVLRAEELEVLAAREHERWRADRMSAGWRHGPTRDDGEKRNPLLVPWTELGEASRASNLAAIAALPALLARAGFEASRR